MRRLLLWDFEGTLARRVGGWSGALREVLAVRERDDKVTADVIAPFLATGFPWHSPWDPRPDPAIPDRWWSDLEPVFARAFAGCGYGTDRAMELAGDVRDAYIQPSRFEVFDDAFPVLEELGARGWEQIILSNHVPELPEIANRLGLAKLVDRVVSSAITGYEKPHPMAYTSATGSRLPDDHIWMIGDDLVADIRGARKNGLRTILVRTAPPSRSTPASRDLWGVPSLVDPPSA